MDKRILLKSVIYGFSGTILLLAIYFSMVSLISGWSFALSQFLQFWYFFIGLTIGFGIQVGLYVYLKTIINQKKNIQRCSGCIWNNLHCSYDILLRSLFC
ncbi:MAG: hypothetical protein KatS3mg097_639 [Candidatus Parcubacteria bacterium]|nr:MAG: hypothetical protein KatS3mg097_639 [Candidatus Parcubacteria bacterium]